MTQNTVKTAELAKIFADQDGRLARLIDQGIVKEAGGRVSIVEAVRAFLEDLRADLRSNTATAAAERAREARASATALRLAEKKRAVIPQSDAEAAVDYLVGAVNSALAAIPARVTRAPETRRTIDHIIFNLRDAIAKEVGSKQ